MQSGNIGLEQTKCKHLYYPNYLIQTLKLKSFKLDQLFKLFPPLNMQSGIKRLEQTKCKHLINLNRLNLINYVNYLI